MSPWTLRRCRSVSPSRTPSSSPPPVSSDGRHQLQRRRCRCKPAPERQTVFLPALHRAPPGVEEVSGGLGVFFNASTFTGWNQVIAHRRPGEGIEWRGVETNQQAALCERTHRARCNYRTGPAYNLAPGGGRRRTLQRGSAGSVVGPATRGQWSSSRRSLLVRMRVTLWFPLSAFLPPVSNPPPPPSSSSLPAVLLGYCTAPSPRGAAGGQTCAEGLRRVWWE